MGSHISHFDISSINDGFIKKHKKTHWSYHGSCSPVDWSKKFPLAKGDHQSPINITTVSASYDENLENSKLNIQYDDCCCQELCNNGHTFQINCDGNHGKINGGPLNNEYNLLQFHVHWGKRNDEGSEHLIDNKSYAAEIHFVHWNSAKYKNPSEAMSSNQHDGLAVLGVMVDIGAENYELQKIINHFKEIKLKGQKSCLGEHININAFLPHDTSSYWTYEGSLTTPPCTQSVQWFIFKDPIHISENQLETFRHLYTCKKKPIWSKPRMKYNFRPTCEINDRCIHKSFA